MPVRVAMIIEGQQRYEYLHDPARPSHMPGLPGRSVSVGFAKKQRENSGSRNDGTIKASVGFSTG